VLAGSGEVAGGEVVGDALAVFAEAACADGEIQQQDVDQERRPLA